MMRTAATREPSYKGIERCVNPKIGRKIKNLSGANCTARVQKGLTARRFCWTEEKQEPRNREEREGQPRSKSIDSILRVISSSSLRLRGSSGCGFTALREK
jgi:hypothetical protein